MIPANELRIGNWVLIQSEKMIKDKTKMHQIKNINTIECHKYEPIPLTPEILEKAGFVVEKYVYMIRAKHIYLSPWEGGRWMLADKNNKDIFPDSSPYITTVHQLQNLYFALCGEELNIQL